MTGVPKVANLQAVGRLLPGRRKLSSLGWVAALLLTRDYLMHHSPFFARSLLQVPPRLCPGAATACTRACMQLVGGGWHAACPLPPSAPPARLPPLPQVVNSTWALKHLQPLPLEDARQGSYVSRMPLGGSQVWLRRAARVRTRQRCSTTIRRCFFTRAEQLVACSSRASHLTLLWPRALAGGRPGLAGAEAGHCVGAGAARPPGGGGGWEGVVRPHSLRVTGPDFFPYPVTRKLCGMFALQELAAPAFS